VGLDDTFIITGAYFRTDHEKEPVERIREAMQEIGFSISVTTMTTVVAFILGCISSIPAIRWLNFYAIPTILMDFVFQLTFFIGRNLCFEFLCNQL
jgi:Niemann-Pick C1 protein